MSARRLHTLISVIVLLALLIQPLGVSAAIRTPAEPVAPAHPFDPEHPGYLFRASVILEGSRNLARLEKTGVQVLDTSDADGKQSALVLVDGEQLADLARLGFRPQAAEELRLLVAAQGPEKHWLAEGLQPLLAQADAVVEQQAMAGVASAAAAPDAAALQNLRTAMRALTPEQLAGVAGSSSVDDDADGLTNTQEAWWCTDPLNPDADADGRSDGAEIQALKDWMANKRAGPTGETPWPSWPFNATTCPDKDHDSIPNLAERWELGLNMDLESSDRDKFDDGQELFGVTYCPGGDLSCGYGDLPRSSDSGYVGATMPSWVKAPGNHPLVAAFPVPEVDVVESSLHVQTVTTVTTDHTIGSGTEKSYSTAQTDGTSSSTTETTTWNNWMEVSSYTYQEATQIAQSTKAKLSAKGIPILGLLGGLATAVGLASDVKGLLGKNQTIWEQLGFAVRPGDGNCLLLEEDVEPNLDDIQLDKQVNLLCAPNAPSGSGCLSADGLIMSGGSSDDLYKSWEFNTLRGDLLGQDKLSISNSGDLLVNGKDPSKHESKLCFGQTQSVNLGQSSSPPAFPEISEVETQGSSHGGEYSTSHTEYEEQTITNGEAFSSNEAWGIATAVDSAHAADLWFTYKVRNTGTEYAREIKHLAFNIYIGDNPNPVCTYHVGSTACGVPVDTVLFANFMPNEEHSYTSFRVPLTLEQMKAVDLGGPVRVVVEDFDYGADELFYQDAASANVHLALEDGIADGDEAIDSYLIPTWGDETVLDVLGRYFPHTTDAAGMLIAVWTPEYRADTPFWCAEPQVVGTGSQRTLWCKHALSTADWWNVYSNGMGDGSEGFQDTPAAPGQTALFRFNSDSDLDGYSDRSEERLGTDPDDPTSYPRPELLAGMHSIRSGNNVVATLSLLNTGLYDAYGVEAVMIAPNDTIAITNNTVGGSGRVRAQKQVIVGSRIVPQTPLPAAWLVAGHAQPSAGGYYNGTTDRTYTFTAADSGSVGAGTLRLNWSDGAGGNGTLNFGAGYRSPTLLDVSNGVKLGLLSGTLNAGESFTVAAKTPRDTFQYTIAAGHESDFTPPVVLVSYNDPQGNHRLAIPPAAMTLSNPTVDLLAFSGQMLQQPGVEIVTDASFAAGANTTDLVVNNPTEPALTDAHLFLEFIDPDGHVVSQVPATTNLPAGPSVVPVTWDSGSFSPAYDPAKDYIVMAFWTDYQGNILDTAARPLSSFQEDPKPAFAISSADETWDFGTAQQGTLLQRTFTLGSVGYGDLLTYLGTISGMTVAGSTSRSLSPGDSATYTVTLNTQSLSVGPFAQEIKVRTSDPEHPEKTITIQGDVTACPPMRPAARRSGRWMSQCRFRATRAIGRASRTRWGRSRRRCTQSRCTVRTTPSCGELENTQMPLVRAQHPSTFSVPVAMAI